MSNQNVPPRADKTHWHIEHSRDTTGTYTLCGCFIPWRTDRGETAAVEGKAARTNRPVCEGCKTIHDLGLDLDGAHLVVPELLAEMDRILQGGKGNV